MSTAESHKALIAPLQAALSGGDSGAVRLALTELFAPDARIRLGALIGVLHGPDALWERAYAPLLAAMPDLERLSLIEMAGPRWGAQGGGDWIGLGGNFVGTFCAPFMGIAATGRPVHMRYHEYLRVVEGRVVEMQALWDVPQLMHKAGVWPMAPQRGVDWMCPGPASGQGIKTGPRDAAVSEASVQIVWDMLHELQQGTATTRQGGLGGFWHENAVWYGPTGLGTARGHRGIAQDICRQFREGLSENTRHLTEGVFFGEGDLVAFTGWPSGTAVHSGDGCLGLAPTGRRVTRASLDVWRVENGLIRECWVMVDMLDLYAQLGVDVFARMAQQIGEAA